MTQKRKLSYYDDVAENLSKKDRSNLKEETKEYLDKENKDVGEIINKQDSSAVKQRIAKRKKLETSDIDENDLTSVRNANPNQPTITLADVADQIYQEYEVDGRNDLEVELEPLVIEGSKSLVKELHVLVSTTEADHQKFLHQLNRKLQTS
jgi:hypothetical protein